MRKGNDEPGFPSKASATGIFPNRRRRNRVSQDLQAKEVKRLLAGRWYQHIGRRPMIAELPDSIPVRLLVNFKGRVVVLCPVGKLNNVPKSFPLNVQEDFMVPNNFVDNSALLTAQGVIYSWAEVGL